jgi:putative acetyltransferase
MAVSLPKPGLRPFLPADGPLLADIFRESIMELTGDDYTEAQRVAWAASADDEVGFVRRLAGGLTLVATLAGSPVGFVTLAGTDTIDLLYVHPAASRLGAATLLVDAIEKLAEARGARRLKTDASDTARDFFAGRGFQVQRRNTVPRGREWLGTTTMEKMLGKAGPSGVKR